MNMNLAITAAQVDTAREPAIGVEVEVYAALENMVQIGSLRATGATAAEYTSAGGLGVPTGGRELILIAAGPITGVTGAMTVTFDVVLEDDEVDTAVATFHLPTYTASSANLFPVGVSANLIPVGVGNSAKKIKTLTGFDSCANQVAGNKFSLWTTPASADFTFIECTRNKGGKFNLPAIVEIACGRNPSAFTKLGRGESNPLSITFANRGELEQLNRFNGHKCCMRFDVIKGGTILSQRILYSGYYVRAMSDYPDGNEEVISTAEGPYQVSAIGYARVSG